VEQLIYIDFVHKVTILNYMNFVQRKITYRLYPNAVQLTRLDEILALHCRAYNALLEEHKRRYDAGEPVLNFTSMCKALTEWRGYADCLRGLNAQSLQVTAKRVALAFDAFFRRVKSGDTPGYPRFKSFKRFTGWGFKTPGDGWRLKIKLAGPKFGYDRLFLTGLGDIPMRGKGRFIGSPCTCEIVHKDGKWYASVTFDVAEHLVMRPTGTEAAAFDWGITTLLTVAKSDGTLADVENPRWLKKKLDSIKVLQRAISAETTLIQLKNDKPADWKMPFSAQSAKLKRMYKELRAVHGKLSRQRKDFYQKLTTTLVERFAFLGTEQLAVKNMSKAPKARPDPEQPGEFLPNGAAAKAGLNRGILDGAPSMLLGLLRYKAAEAGSVFAEANTRVLKPTQRCHGCGAIVTKTLSERRHVCACGTDCGRDENAAKTILRWLLEGDFWLGTSRQPQG